MLRNHSRVKAPLGRGEEVRSSRKLNKNEGKENKKERVNKKRVVLREDVGRKSAAGPHHRLNIPPLPPLPHTTATMRYSRFSFVLKSDPTGLSTVA